MSEVVPISTVFTCCSGKLPYFDTPIDYPVLLKVGQHYADN